MTEIPATCPSAALAKLIGRTERTIRSKKADGSLPVAEDGRIDLRAIVLLGIEAAAQKRGGEALDLTVERARLAKEQADAQEMRNAVMRAELVPASQVVRAVSAIIGACRARLLGIPARAAPQIVGIESRSEARDVLAAMVREACAELSQKRVEDEMGLRGEGAREAAPEI